MPYHHLLYDVRWKLAELFAELLLDLIGSHPIFSRCEKIETIFFEKMTKIDDFDFAGKLYENKEIRKPLNYSASKEYVSNLRLRLKEVQPKLKWVTVGCLNRNVSLLATSVQVNIGKHLTKAAYDSLVAECLKDVRPDDEARPEYDRDAAGSPIYNFVSMMVITANPTKEYDAWKDSQKRKRETAMYEAEILKKKKAQEEGSLMPPGKGTITKQEWTQQILKVQKSNSTFQFSWDDVNETYKRCFIVYVNDEEKAKISTTSYSISLAPSDEVAIVLCSGPLGSNSTSWSKSRALEYALRI